MIGEERVFAELNKGAPGAKATSLITGVILNLWLYYRGNIGATILAHAAANATIYVLVVFPDLIDLAKDLDLRFFL